MLKKLALILLIIPVPALAVFMVVGKKVNYLDSGARLQYAGQGSVVVMTRDERPYVLSGDKKPDFVGLLRGGFGNTFDVVNETTHPVADDISASMAASLNAAGFTASVELPVAGETAEQAVTRVAAKTPDRFLLVRVINLKQDGYASYTWHGEVTISVYDRSGALLQSFDSKLAEPIGKVTGKYVDFAAKVTHAYRVGLETWLNDAKLQTALAQAAAPVAPTEPVAPDAAPATDSAD